jgi:undecaprenyl-diphosphatase
MNSLEAFILGIIQGLTEFLPVSSSGHLELAKVLFGSNVLPKESLLFTVLLHLATALSTVVLYRKDIALIVRRVLVKDAESITFATAILVSMIPAAFVGFFFEEFIDSLFSGNLLLVGGLLLVTALLLYIADTYPSASKELTLKKALIVGLSQAVAVLPGISRSGATISTAVVLGVDRTQAARFSFLMVVPLIFGKIAKDLLGGDLMSTSIDPLHLLIGFSAAFIAGLIACNWMIALVKRSKLIYFALYCLTVGGIAIASSFLL